MLDSPMLGFALYLFQIAAAFAVGILDARLLGGNTSGMPPLPPRKRNRLFFTLAEALREAADAMVGICGAVIFFSTLGGMVSLLPFPDILRCLLVCLLEITAGASLTASLLPLQTAFVLIAGAVGWSGFSIHAQTVMVTGGKLKVGRYLLSKALTALFTALFAAVALILGIV